MNRIADESHALVSRDVVYEKVGNRAVGRLRRTAERSSSWLLKTR
jgi:hypothetical protein